MGATGTGKSTFINLVSRSNLRVGNGLQSCTEAVGASNSFPLDGRRVTLIDTPGFDDTTRSDTDVLNMIALFLENSYKQGTKLAGVLYFHRISDFRVGGISTRNFKMFRKLCGDSTLHNVLIVTNMWGEVELRTGSDREAELMKEDIFFKPVLDKGAQMDRHLNTAGSAEHIIRRILDNHPLPLRIQQELVDEHKSITETGAAEELNREFNERVKGIQIEMRTLREEMEQAIRDKDEETRMELEISAKKMQREMERYQNDARRLEHDYLQERQRLEARILQMESEARQGAAYYQQQINQMRNSMYTNSMYTNPHAEQMERANKQMKKANRARIAGTVALGAVSLLGALLGGQPGLF
ncbi:hypothetical protein BJ322DRAFT_269416 [Thelephora terrestris]|uniref:G domain-containing protein n=1 Tax=Thelephora terrestris TaxID=56493 RepID=A0A9P6L3N1_9AGAM|nr:hypothetical protein BJ322DRAFT_269416 [Thelephora terrestris]